MRIKVMSLNKGYERYMKNRIKLLLKNHTGIKLVRFRPDFVLTYGGDGSILYAERKYPGIPKIVIKKSHFCNKCDYPEEELDNILKYLESGKYSFEEYSKIEAICKGKVLRGLNEVQIRNKYPVQSIRYDLYVIENGKDNKIMSNVVGDGILFSTPFGSSSYYKVLGGRNFEEGIGVALNNVLRKYNKKPIVYPKNSVFKVRILRGKAYLARDNDYRMIDLKEGSEVFVRMSKEVARFVVFDKIKVLSSYFE